jgi:hypothetical protein
MECIMCHKSDGLLLMLKQGSFIHAFCAFHSLKCAPRGTGPIFLQSYRPSLTLRQVKEAIHIRHPGGGFCGICFRQEGVIERSRNDNDEQVHAYCQAKKFGAVNGEDEQVGLVVALVDDATLSLSNMKTF